MKNVIAAVIVSLVATSSFATDVTYNDDMTGFNNETQLVELGDHFVNNANAGEDSAALYQNDPVAAGDASESDWNAAASSFNFNEGEDNPNHMEASDILNELTN